MNKELFKQLCLNFNKEPNKDLFELWNNEFEVFGDMVDTAIKNIMKKDKFMPNLNRVYEELRSIEYEYITDEKKIKKWVQNGVKPCWYGEEIINKELDDVDKKEFDDFINFIEEFRDE